MNFSDEEYVRLYVRDTVTWEMLPWQAKALLCLALRKFDRSGLFEFGHYDPTKALASKTTLPSEHVEIGLKAILDEKIWELEENCFFWPKYTEAQTCRRSDRLRKRLERANAKNKPFYGEKHEKRTGCHEIEHSVQQADVVSQNVTECHILSNVSQPVTGCHSRQGKARQGVGEARQSQDRETPTPRDPTKPKPADPFRASFRTQCPDKLDFSEKHRGYATRGSIDINLAWVQFREDARSKATHLVDWDAAFLASLTRSVERIERAAAIRATERTAQRDDATVPRTRQNASGGTGGPPPTETVSGSQLEANSKKLHSGLARIG